MIIANSQSIRTARVDTAGLCWGGRRAGHWGQRRRSPCAAGRQPAATPPLPERPVTPPPWLAAWPPPPPRAPAPHPGKGLQPPASSPSAESAPEDPPPPRRVPRRTAAESRSRLGRGPPLAQRPQPGWCRWAVTPATTQRRRRRGGATADGPLPPIWAPNPVRTRLTWLTRLTRASDEPSSTLVHSCVLDNAQPGADQVRLQILWEIVFRKVFRVYTFPSDNAN